jgi:hypothetical protein
MKRGIIMLFSCITFAIGAQEKIYQIKQTDLTLHQTNDSTILITTPQLQYVLTFTIITRHITDNGKPFIAFSGGECIVLWSKEWMRIECVEGGQSLLWVFN